MMKPSLYKLSLKTFWLEKSSKEVVIIFLALCSAVLLSTVVDNLYQGINKAFLGKATQMVGAELILESTNRIGEDIIKEAKHLKLEQGRLLSFFSMASSENGFQLVNVKAYEAPLPLHGEFHLNNGVENYTKTDLPQNNELWVPKVTMDRLKLDIGDELQIGAIKFIVANELLRLPGLDRSPISLAPDLVMPFEQVVNTKALTIGARFTEQLYLNGELDLLERFKQYIKTLDKPELKIASAEKQNVGITQVLTQVKRFLSIMVLMVMILSGVSIAISARSFALRKTDEIALLRSFGCSQQNCLQYLMGFVSCLYLTAVPIGLIAGLALSKLLQLYAQAAFGIEYTVITIQSIQFSLIVGAILIFGFGFAPMLRLKNIRTVHLLRSQVSLLSLGSEFYLGAIALLFGFLYIYLEQSKVVILMIASLILLVAFLWAVNFGFFTLVRLVRQLCKGSLRIGMDNLIQRRRENQVFIIAFTLIIMSSLILVSVNNDIFAQWQSKLAKGTPNYFLVNVEDFQLGDIKQFFKEEEIAATPLYPMLRARITHINQEAVFDDLNTQSQERTRKGLFRSINLTWTDQLPFDNRIVLGKNWIQANWKDGISIEEGFATRLAIKLGDRIQFQFEEESFSAKVINIRQVDWSSFSPNFFVIFPPNVLNELPHNYMTSFYLEAHKESSLYKFASLYPQVSVISIDEILAQVQALLGTSSKLFQALAFGLGLLGILVLMAITLMNIEQRIKQFALLRILGCPKTIIYKATLIEFGLIASFVAAFAILGTVVTSYYLATSIFELQYKFSGYIVALGSSLALFSIVFIGMLASMQVLTINSMYLIKNRG